MQFLVRTTLFLLVTTPFAAVIASGCSGPTGDSTQSTGGSSSTQSTGGGGSSTQSTGGGSSSTQSTGGAGAGGGTPGVFPAPCMGHVYACGDTVDNDNDALVDWQDPDCTGPCDYTEDSYLSSLPNALGCAQDCYWDNDSGAGNDDCHWDHRCDEHEVAPNYYPESQFGIQCEFDPTLSTCNPLYMTQSPVCHAVCGPLTPNGCDCFGCCELPGNPGNYVWLGSRGPSGTTECTLEKLTDPDVCSPCKPVPACLNPCECGEVCIGKPDPACPDPDGGTEQCPGGENPCGLQGQPLCPSGYYCITGCCQPLPM